MKNFLILAPVITVIFASGYLLFKDYHNPPTIGEVSQNREPIGEVVSREKNVLRQFGQDVIWNDVDKKDTIFLQDSVRTGKDGNTTIKLSDNTVVEIAENSLVVFDKFQGSLDLKFKTGEVAVENTSPKFQVQVNGNRVATLGASLKIRSDDGGLKTKVTVAKGKATITDKNAKVSNLDQDESTILSDTGTTRLEKNVIQLKSPEDKTEVSSNIPKTMQSFTWAVMVDKTPSPEHFEISSNDKFPKGSTQQILAHQAVTAPLAPGNNFWRVGWDDAQKHHHFSETRTLLLSGDKRLTLFYPENETKFQFEPTANQVELQWKSALDSKVFMLDIARSSDFRNIVKSETIKGVKGTSNQMIKNLESGNYFWRVKAFGDKNEILATSNIFSFGIKVKLPALPELIKPSMDESITDAAPISFSWKKMDDAENYRINISSDSDQKNIIKTQVVKTELLATTIHSQSSVYWSVTALNATSLPIGRSETRKLNFTHHKAESAFALTNPPDGSQVDRPLSSGAIVDPILFQWKVLRPLPDSITMEVSDNAAFLNSQIFKDLKRFSQEATLTAKGKYYWRLSSTSPTNQLLTEISSISSFLLRNVNIIVPPQLISPDDKAKLETDDLIGVKFTWKPVLLAVQYHINVEKLGPSPADKKIVMDKVVAEDNVISPRLPEGQYQWSVSSLDKDGQEGSVGHARTFSVGPVEQMDAPQLNAPVVK